MNKYYLKLKGEIVAPSKWRDKRLERIIEWLDDRNFLTKEEAIYWVNKYSYRSMDKLIYNQDGNVIGYNYKIKLKDANKIPNRKTNYNGMTKRSKMMIDGVELKFSDWKVLSVKELFKHNTHLTKDQVNDYCDHRQIDIRRFIFKDNNAVDYMDNTTYLDSIVIPDLLSRCIDIDTTDEISKALHLIESKQSHRYEATIYIQHHEQIKRDLSLDKLVWVSLPYDAVGIKSDGSVVYVDVKNTAGSCGMQETQDNDSVVFVCGSVDDNTIEYKTNRDLSLR